MKRSQSFSSSLCSNQILAAEHELSAFIAAVTELFGPNQASFSAQDWLDELESTDGPTPFTSRDWRPSDNRGIGSFANSAERCTQRPDLARHIDNQYESIPDTFV